MSLPTKKQFVLAARQLLFLQRLTALWNLCIKQLATNVIEDRANETERTLRQKLEFAEKRVEALEADLHSSERRLAEMQAKLKESEGISRTDRSRLEVAEKRICELEMRARTAEAQAKNNSHTLARIEEAIRTQILEKRLPTNKLTLSG